MPWKYSELKALFNYSSLIRCTSCSVQYKHILFEIRVLLSYCRIWNQESTVPLKPDNVLNFYITCVTKMANSEVTETFPPSAGTVLLLIYVQNDSQTRDRQSYFRRIWVSSRTWPSSRTWTCPSCQPRSFYSSIRKTKYRRSESSQDITKYLFSPIHYDDYNQQLYSSATFIRKTDHG